LARKTRMAATYLGAWIVFLVVVIYGPVLIGALADPSTAVKVEGLNYFADTLLLGGVILSLARAMTGSDTADIVRDACLQQQASSLCDARIQPARSTMRRTFFLDIPFRRTH
jgi:hypothetical protein